MVRNIGSSIALVAITLFASIELIHGGNDPHHIKIDSDGVYADFKAGYLNSKYNTVDVYKQGYKDVAHFSNETRYRISFYAENLLKRGVVDLYPRNRALKVFIDETGLPFNLPNDYASYQLGANILVENNAYIDFILTCSQAETLTFDDLGDVAPRLLQRERELDNLTNLRYLRLVVDKRGLGETPITPFFRRLPELKVIVLHFYGLHSSEEIDAYLEAQEIPGAWERHPWKTNRKRAIFIRRF